MPLRISTWIALVWFFGTSARPFFCSAGAAEAGTASSKEMVNILVAQLCDAMSPLQKKFILDEPLVVEKAVLPYVKPVELIRNNQPGFGVAISDGFIALANHVAYARAKSSVEKKSFEPFILELAKESGAQPLAELAGMADRSKWSLQLSNEQLTQFNQIVATMIAIDLAHHYLGHYKKYQSKLTDSEGQAVPINSLLTADEWEDAVIAGALNALDCGIATDGIKTVFECIDKMPQRPAWTIYFMPAKADLRRLYRGLSKLEKGFFRGRR